MHWKCNSRFATSLPGTSHLLRSILTMATRTFLKLTVSPLCPHLSQLLSIYTPLRSLCFSWGFLNMTSTLPPQGLSTYISPIRLLLLQVSTLVTSSLHSCLSSNDTWEERLLRPSCLPSVLTHAPGLSFHLPCPLVSHSMCYRVYCVESWNCLLVSEERLNVDHLVKFNHK